MRSFRSLAVFGLLALTGIACNPTDKTKDTKSAGVTIKTEAIKEAPKKPAEPSMAASTAPECKAPPVVKIAWSTSLDRALLASSSTFEDILEAEGQLGKVEQELCVDIVLLQSDYQDNLKAYEAGTVDGALLSATDLFTVATGRKKQIDDTTLVAMILSWETAPMDAKADPKVNPTKTLSVLAMGENQMGAGEDPTHTPSGVLAVKALSTAMDRMVARLDPTDPEMRTKVLTALSTRLGNIVPTTQLEQDLIRFMFVTKDVSTCGTPEFVQMVTDLQTIAVANKTMTARETYTIGNKTVPNGDTISILRFDDSLTLRQPVIKMEPMEIKPVEAPASANTDPVLTKAPPVTGTVEIPVPTQALPTPASKTP